MSEKKISVALIAHDGKKSEMINFAQNNLEKLREFDIVATGTTGKHLHDAGLSQTKSLLSGPLGGDAQIASLVAEKKIDFVFFFRDPLGKHVHEPDILMLMRLCDVHNVPLVTNVNAAKLLLKAL